MAINCSKNVKNTSLVFMKQKKAIDVPTEREGGSLFTN